MKGIKTVNTHKVKRSKHNKLIDSLEQMILENCVGVIDTQKNVEYPQGEIDLLVLYIDRAIYFEVKSNHTPKSYNKGFKQLKRWTTYMRGMDRLTDYIGVYWTPQFKTPLFKNGYRHN